MTFLDSFKIRVLSFFHCILLCHRFSYMQSLICNIKQWTSAYWSQKRKTRSCCRKASIKRILMGFMDRKSKYILQLAQKFCRSENVFKNMYSCKRYCFSCIWYRYIQSDIHVQCQQLKKEKVWRSG